MNKRQIIIILLFGLALISIILFNNSNLNNMSQDDIGNKVTKYKIDINPSAYIEKTNRWRFKINITLTNMGDTPVTINWVWSNTTHIQYVNQEKKPIGISGNYSINHLLDLGESILVSFTLTEYGFNQEPIGIWEDCLIKINEKETPISLPYYISYKENNLYKQM